MKNLKFKQNGILTIADDASQRGSAIVISLFVLALISVFVALALSRSAAEAAATGNETAESRAFYAAQGSLETMTRNFNKKFEININPTSADFNDVRTSGVPGLSSPVGNFTFNQEVLKTSTPGDPPVILPGGPFGGLYAKQDNWRLRTTATDNVGVEVQLTRNILNNLIPIFQFGIFYDDNLEFHPGPRFDFGGRVHSNGSLFLMASTGLYFSSKVTAANHIFTDTGKNGTYSWNDNVFVKNASGAYVRLYRNMGSVLTTPVNGPPVTSNPPSSIPLPTAYVSANWPTNQTMFDGNLQAQVPPLQLPIILNSNNTGQGLDLVEIVKRGKAVGDLWNDGTGSVTSPNIIPVTTANADDAITAAERYYNKTGIRVSLADSKAKLPGCASVAATTPCGVRLDGESTGQTIGEPIGGVRGYVPRLMTGTPYQASGINGDRFHMGIANRELWIKVETVIYNPTTEVYDIFDITQDILALGVTDSLPPVTSPPASFTWNDNTYFGNDARSIIKLQRFLMPGPSIPNTTGASGTGTYISNFTDSGSSKSYNYVLARSGLGSSSNCSAGGTLVNGGLYTNNGFAFTGDVRAQLKMGMVNGVKQCLAPFPNNMFDTREGLYNDSTGVFDPTAAANYGLNVPWAGVMSMVDIDVANLRQFLLGTWDSNMPTGTPYYVLTGHVLRSTDIPQPNNVAPKSGGWVFYVSDRRGDFDFDGEYDMEDVYSNGTLDVGEDINKNGTLQLDTDCTVNPKCEAAKYTGVGSNISPDIAALFEHKYYRRGVRLINGVTLVGGVRTVQTPGTYDTVTPTNTSGFTLATENGAYVLGDFNASSILNVGTPTASTDYVPLSTSSRDVPASIASDAVIILSNNWQDSLSFSSPFNMGNRTATETFDRFGMLSGDTITSLAAAANQGGGDLDMNGGVHNFKRFLENWGGVRLNYSGSLINLYNSHNNNGTFKCCVHVYSPPQRNWIFDATFLDINRLPPGTPYFQYVQTTGFQRTNN